MKLCGVTAWVQVAALGEAAGLGSGCGWAGGGRNLLLGSADE